MADESHGDSDSNGDNDSGDNDLHSDSKGKVVRFFARPITMFAFA
jgi:hypothetical protein